MKVRQKIAAYGLALLSLTGALTLAVSGRVRGRS